MYPTNTNTGRRKLGMYSPKINPEHVRKLYLLKASLVSVDVNKPMTELVREALDDYIPKTAQKILNAGGTLVMADELTEK